MCFYHITWYCCKGCLHVITTDRNTGTCEDALKGRYEECEHETRRRHVFCDKELCTFCSSVAVEEEFTTSKLLECPRGLHVICACNEIPRKQALAEDEGFPGLTESEMKDKEERMKKRRDLMLEKKKIKNKKRSKK